MDNAPVATASARKVGSRPAGRPRPMLDMAHALDLLATAVQQCGGCSATPPVLQQCGCATGGRPRCLVCYALSLDQLHSDALEALRDRTVREIYAADSLPVQLTFGAMAVLDAAQRSQDRGSAWAEALGEAAAVATRYLDLIPDRVLPA